MDGSSVLTNKKMQGQNPTESGRVKSIHPAPFLRLSTSNAEDVILNKNSHSFDQESGLYYLKSRYYDPQVKRFLNPDSITFLPGVVNHNIFTYCNNNPVNMIDTDGHYSASLSDNPGNDDRYEYYKAKKEIEKESKKDPRPPMVNVTEDKDIIPAINSGERFNYKGVRVVRHTAPGLTSFAINGTIYLNQNVTNQGDQINTLKHEYGHTIQEQLFGEELYVKTVAIPSVSNAYKGMSYKDYYS